jgi:hypothetical protein
MCRQRGEVARLHQKVFFLPVVNVKLTYKTRATVGPGSKTAMEEQLLHGSLGPP